MKQLATACDPEGVPQGAALVGGGLEMEELDSPHHSGHHCPCGVGSGPMAGAEALRMRSRLGLLPECVLSPLPAVASLPLKGSRAGAQLGRHGKQPARAQSRPTDLRPHGLQPARLLCPWDSPGKDPGVGDLEPGIEPASLALAGRSLPPRALGHPGQSHSASSASVEPQASLCPCVTSGG